MIISWHQLEATDLLAELLALVGVGAGILERIDRRGDDAGHVGDALAGEVRHGLHEAVVLDAQDSRSGHAHVVQEHLADAGGGVLVAHLGKLVDSHTGGVAIDQEHRRTAMDVVNRRILGDDVMAGASMPQVV